MTKDITEDEAERLLLILADPLRWLGGTTGILTSETDKCRYQIHPARNSYDVDLTRVDYLPLLNVSPHRDYLETYALSVASIDEAKGIAARHASSGNLTEIREIYKRQHQAAFEFEMLRSRTDYTLTRLLQSSGAPALTWTPPGVRAMRFSATSARGKYKVAFSSERRWVVQVRVRGSIVGELCFLTRDIAKKACALHSHTDEWHGTLAHENRLLTSAIIN